MSRKHRIAEEDKAEWSTIKQWTLARGYSAYRAQDAVPAGTLVIVTHLRGAAPHPLMDVAPALARRLLDEGAAGPGYPLPPLVLVLDLSGLAKDAKGVAALLDAEGARIDFVKSGVGKATARALEKLHLRGATLVASGKGCQLLLKILLTGERQAEGGWAKLVLLHPILPADTVNGVLAAIGGGATGEHAGRQALKKGHAASTPVHVIFESAAAQAKRLEILQASFPRLSAAVLPGHAALPKPEAALALLAPALLGESAEEAAAAAAAADDAQPFDPEHMDAVGRMLWLGELQIIMSPHTKQ